MDGTSLFSILEYAKILYETGRYIETKFILKNFLNIIGDNKKHLAKLILSQWSILCVDFLNGDFSEAKKNFEKINLLVDELKSNYDEELKKINSESVKLIKYKIIFCYLFTYISSSLFIIISQIKPKLISKRFSYTEVICFI